MTELVILLAAFGGGVFGCLIGGTITFAFTGLLALIGIAVSLAGGGDFVLNQLAFGPVFGPHVAFVGAAAATAYAGKKSIREYQTRFRKSVLSYIKKQYIEADFLPVRRAEGSEDPKRNSELVNGSSSILAKLTDSFVRLDQLQHDSQTAAQVKKEIDLMTNDDEAFNQFKTAFIDGADTSVPLYKTMDPAVVLVGGIFGMMGYMLDYLFAVAWTIPVDHIALTVVSFGIIVRLLFGNTGIPGFLCTDLNKNQFKGKDFLFHAIWGFGLAGVIGYVSLLTEINSIGFALSAFSLIFLYFGLKFPVSHHITMVAGYAALTFGSVWAGALFGLLAVLLGELIIRIINTQTETHIDMPAIVIASLSILILGVLA